MMLKQVLAAFTTASATMACFYFGGSEIYTVSFGFGMALAFVLGLVASVVGLDDE